MADAPTIGKPERAGFTEGPWELDADCGEVYSPSAHCSVAMVLMQGNWLENAALIRAAPALYEALADLLEHYVELVNCGDCGRWDPETEIVVKDARSALALAHPTPDREGKS